MCNLKPNYIFLKFIEKGMLIDPYTNVNLLTQSVITARSFSIHILELCVIYRVRIFLIFQAINLIIIIVL